MRLLQDNPSAVASELWDALFCLVHHIEGKLLKSRHNNKYDNGGTVESFEFHVGLNCSSDVQESGRFCLISVMHCTLTANQ